MTKPKNPSITLSNGHVAWLPESIHFAEATLEGNWQELQEGLLAAYDPKTQTGLVYMVEYARWTMMQPVSRLEFAASLAESRRAKDQVDDALAKEFKNKGKTH
jgi:hypothetical protein